MKERIASYIAHDLLNNPGLSLAFDEDLLGSGIIDSLSVMSLVHFIEREAKVSVPPEDVTIENFMTLDAIAAYIERRRGGVSQ